MTTVDWSQCTYSDVVMTVGVICSCILVWSTGMLVYLSLTLRIKIAMATSTWSYHDSWGSLHMIMSDCLSHEWSGLTACPGIHTRSACLSHANVTLPLAICHHTYWFFWFYSNDCIYSLKSCLFFCSLRSSISPYVAAIRHGWAMWAIACHL